MPYYIKVNGGSRKRFRFLGFKDRRNAHRHLFKHIVRLSDQDRNDSRSVDDPEEWSEVINDPPLKKTLPSRRKKAKKELAEVADCLIKNSKPATKSPCQCCQSATAIAEVDEKFKSILTAYEKVAEDAFEWGFNNPRRDGPRVLAYRDNGRTIKVKVVANRRVKAVGVLDPDTGNLRLVTCFRHGRGKKNRLVNRSDEMIKEQAGFKNMNKLVNLEVFQVPNGINGIRMIELE